MHQTTQSVEETQALAEKWMEAYKDQKIWLLKGELGAGKTSFVKGIAKALDQDPDKIKSPTFSIIEEHDSWIHVDLYRLEQEDPYIREELNEYLKAGFMLFIEWPERIDMWQDQSRVEVDFLHLGEDKRSLTLTLLP